MSAVLSTLLAAIGLFIITNIDDVIVLALFFTRARTSAEPGRIRAIVIGQYLGFIGIVAVALVAAVGLGYLIPPRFIPLLGLLPLAIGLRAGWEEWREWKNDDDDDDDDDLEVARARRSALSTLAVAGITFANGGDNIGVYVPVFTTAGWGAIAIYVTVFLVLVAVLCWVAWFVANRRAVAELLERWESVLFPLVMVLLGVSIILFA